ncbi:MAG TPA: DUF2950 domain-containing protein [Vicinamibacterales bacterium]|jgi:hypothetical protein
MNAMSSVRSPRLRAAVVAASACALAALLSIGLSAQPAPHRVFATPEAAVQALIDTVKAGNLDELIAIFGPDSRDLVASSDPATGRENREVFTVAAAERWHLVDDKPNRKTLVIGNEDWPFPVPLAKTAAGWLFDTAAGKEEVIDRRIGQNELAAIDTCHAYVTAQHRYAQSGHDGRPEGLYAATFNSDPGKENGLYWPAVHPHKLSPLGDLLAQAAQDGRPVDPNRAEPAPYNGYYFKILTAQGAHVSGGAKSYIKDGNMSGGFALVAWPAQYNATGVMTFLVDQSGVVHEKDLGTATDATVKQMTAYNPDASWHPVR